MEDTQVVGALVRRCVAGDVVAWEEIVRQYHRRIYNICYRFAGSTDDAQDLTQEVFIKMYRTLGSYDADRGAFLTWITTVTRNLLVDHFRRSKQDRVDCHTVAARLLDQANAAAKQSVFGGAALSHLPAARRLARVCA